MDEEKHPRSYQLSRIKADYMRPVNDTYEWVINSMFRLMPSPSLHLCPCCPIKLHIQFENGG